MGIIPPINPTWIPIIIETGKKVWDFIKGFLDKDIKTVSEANPLTKESSANEIRDMQQVFTNLQQQIASIVQETEQKVMIEVNEYFEQFEFLFQSNSSLNKKYNISTTKYEREINRIQRQCEGFIEREVSTSVNLLNAEVNQILTMLPGQKKETALKSFIASTLQMSLNKFADFFEDELKYLATLIEEDISEQIEQLRRVNSDMFKQLQELENNYNQDNEVYSDLQLDIYLKLKLANDVQQILTN